MEIAKNIILLLFEHERNGYKRHADCTVLHQHKHIVVQKRPNLKICFLLEVQIFTIFMLH